MSGPMKLQGLQRTVWPGLATLPLTSHGQHWWGGPAPLEMPGFGFPSLWQMNGEFTCRLLERSGSKAPVMHTDAKLWMRGHEQQMRARRLVQGKAGRWARSQPWAQRGLQKMMRWGDQHPGFLVGALHCVCVPGTVWES